MDQAEILKMALDRLDAIMDLGQMAIPDDEDAVRRTVRAYIRNPIHGGISNLCTILAQVCEEYVRDATSDSEAADYETAATEFNRLERVLDRKYA